MWLLFQVAPTFGDAPGILKISTTKRQSSDNLLAFHPKPAKPLPPALPEVTTVFCAPAQYKVWNHSSAVIIIEQACLSLLCLQQVIFESQFII